MKSVWITAVLLMGLTLPEAGIAQSIDSRCTAPDTTSCVDWENAIAIAVGMGAPAMWAKSEAQRNLSARRAATLDAARNLVELIKGVNITSNTTTQGMMLTNDTVVATIQGRLRGIRPVEAPKYFSDGSVQIKLEARLRDLLPQELYASSAEPKLLGPPVGSPAGSLLNTSSVYSGLVIDARGTGVTPAMSPKVYDPEQREVYGSAYVSREFAISQGMVGYIKSVEKAMQSDRVKGKPALVKALQASGKSNADLVIAQKDADALREISRSQTFLREGRVMVVLD